MVRIPLLAGALLALALLLRRLLGIAHATPASVSGLRDSTVIDEDGAVRSVQAADLEMPAAALDAIWSPAHLERLARTYWRFLTRITLGLVRVVYTPGERRVVLLGRPFVLLRFDAPEYELDAERGIVRWRVRDGLLVARHGHHRDGYLEIDVRRRPGERPDEVKAHVEVEVANFFPSIAHRIGTPVYKATQSQVHVVVTYGFLRSLARLDLAESRVGALAGDADEAPPPPSADQP